MSTNEPSGSAGLATPASPGSPGSPDAASPSAALPSAGATEEVAEELEEALLEEDSEGAPEIEARPIAGGADAAEEIDGGSIEVESIEEVAVVAEAEPSPVRALPPVHAPPPVHVPPPPPRLPGITNPQVAPARPAAEPETPPLESLDETIGAAKTRARMHATDGGRALSAIYEAELSALGTQSRGRLAVYAHEIGVLAREAGDEGAAVKAWARALQADPSLRPNLWALRRAFERRSMWPNVQRLLEAELRFASTPAERAELLIERGVLLEDRMGDPAAAVEVFEAAAKADPSAIRAFMALERRLLEDGGDPERLRRVLGGLAAATRDPARRAALLIDLARLEAEAGEDGFSRARAALDEALALELGERGEPAYAGSGAPAALDELERLALRAKRPEWREEALTTRLRLLALDQVSRPPASSADAERLARGVVLVLRQAAIAEERDDSAAAITHLETAAALAVHDPVAARVIACDLREAAHASGRWELVGRLALAAADEAPASLRGALHLEAIDAFERAGLEEESRVAVSRAESAGLGDVLEIRARRRAEADGDDEALARSYLGEGERAIAAGAVAVASAAFAKAAAIVGDRLGRHDEAIALHERSLLMTPAGGLHDEHANALEWRLARLGRYEAWAALVEKRLAAEASGPRRRILLERKVALLAEAVGDLDGALAAIRELVLDRPEELSLRYELVALIRRAGRPREAAQELAEIIARTEAPARKAELELERGALLAWGAADVAGAEGAFREALRLSPGDSRATAALEELFDRKEDTAAPELASASAEPARVDALAAALRAGIDAGPSAERAAALLSRLAELHERERHDAKAAAAVYKELFDRAGETAEQAVAIRGLIRCYASLGDADALIGALERELELVGEGPAQAFQRARIAWQKERRGRTEAAEEDHRHLLEAEPSAAPDVLASARLGRLRAAYRAYDAAEIAEALGPLVTLVDVELASARAALDLEHAAALAAQDEHDEAAAVIARVQHAQPESRAAHLAALMIAGRRHDARGVGAAMAGLADGMGTPLAKAGVLRRAGLSVLVGGDAGEAQARLRAAFDIARDDETLVALAELSDDAEILAARVELCEGADRSPWLIALGEAQARSGQLAAATETLAQALSLAPNSLFSLELDRRVRLAAGDRRGHATRTLALGELIADGERAAALLVDAGRAFEELGEVEAAVYAYREVLARTPFDGAVYARARAMLSREASGGDRVDWAKATLLELYTHRFEHVNDLPERIDVLLERAALYSGADDHEHAERDLRSVLELDPDEARGVWALAQLCARDGARLDETRSLLTGLAALQIDPARRREAALLAADIEEHAGGDPERALPALEIALEIEEDASTLRRLGARLLAQRYWQRAIDARRRLIPRVPAVDGATLELEIAAIYLDGFSDESASRAAALRALALDPLSTAAVDFLSGASGEERVLGESALSVLAVAEEAARGLLVEAEQRAHGLAALRRLAGLRGDAELGALSAQLESVFNARAVEARPLEALPGRPLDEAVRPLLRAASVDGVLRELLAAVAELGARLHPIDVGRMGKLHRLSTKQRMAEVAALDEIARLVGATGFEVEVGDGAILQSDDARVVIGREVIATLPRALGRFRAARALTLFSDRLGLLDRVDDAAFVALCAGCLAIAKLPWPESLAALRPAGAAFDAAARAVDDAISRRERKAVVALAPRLAALPDPLRFRAAALASAARTGLFIAGDLSAVATELGPEPAAELGRFAVSAPFLAARRRWKGGS